MTAPPAGPAEAEGEAGAGDPPGGVLPGQAFDAGGLGDGEPDRGDAGRAGCPPRAGTGASPSGMRRSASLMSSWPWWRAPAG